MKYMGSKRAMLHNGLGKLLARELPTVERFIDLFAGSAVVSTYVACDFDVRVLAYDLQRYSVVLANAVLTRNAECDWLTEWNSWLSRAKKKAESVRCYQATWASKRAVLKARAWSADQTKHPITRAYGGHYFSPNQAIWLDALRATLPRLTPTRTVCLAALIGAASHCAAAPGHTAQPFQPTRTALPFLRSAWSRDAVEATRAALERLAGRFARKLGTACTADANRVATSLGSRDLVFVDPPYSAVQYSRFYHVLESIASGDFGAVSGTGRYPLPEHRPRSRYSMVSESSDALDELLGTVAATGARVILTFPNHECSNGLSGDTVREMARDHFYIRTEQLDSNFSTLGGRSRADVEVTDRSARRATEELILVLDPK